MSLVLCSVQSLQKYVDSMERAAADSDMEPDDLEDDREVDTQVQRVPSADETATEKQPSEEEVNKTNSWYTPCISKAIK